MYWSEGQITAVKNRLMIKIFVSLETAHITKYSAYTANLAGGLMSYMNC